MSINSTTTSKESLFQIGEHYYALESLIISNEGEIDVTIDQWLEEYQAKEADKVDAYCYLIQKFQEIAEEAHRLAERSSNYSRKAKTLKDRLKCYLQRRGRDKVETFRFTITVCQNGGKQPVKLFDQITPANIPGDYLKVYKEPDMEAIREALLNNKKDVQDLATLLPRGTHLRIK